MTIYLTIDTSAAITVGLAQWDLGVVRELAVESSPHKRHHAELLAPMVRSVLDIAGISAPDAVIVGTGPGAFTGLRAGLVTARTLARAWNVELYGLSSLDIMALGALDQGAQIIVPMIDARRKEVFAARMHALGADDVEIVQGPSIYKPDEVAQMIAAQPGVVAVSEADLYPSVGVHRVEVGFAPAVMARLVQSRIARIQAGENLTLDTEPQYLRRPDVHEAGHSQPAAEGNPYAAN
ncbi:tRNA (adenosine(37)-N6)-threonylcarbamoyltransferase complex dimerization subunit type 1 TsaB [Arcanobacterium pinnipediorum]|uniref:tRNA (Adenosine(37)-N6)-threonylcarbamoyltransferase complex dimerization subunit type 1 TsaB n=1 Tax=Arcanobacterium pinnipediorum TaxID=1503041 RepID=A0ABY5AFU3_9ACTO|nr:tRNA (adenosine(37)-N6)-threonylcarbamoyltransferase complex dimerization subunit type 1 TsaB [Arcanobacterium pinnipediorum]USR79055.1 tRNA (adenosine(37)-N6)-threonylcarbamoyltransferase complex dimerization subunit type 1 TsaB [Arcanobacterium pinnipediorum]